MPGSESNAISALGRARPSAVHIALLIPWVGVVLGVRRPLRDNSFLWHVEAGRRQIEAGRVLTEDPFSFTRSGVPWRTQSWLADLVYGKLHEWSDLQWVPWLTGIVLTVTVVAAMVTAHRLTRSLPIAATIGALTMWAVIPYMNPRPVLVSYLLMALVVLAVHCRRLIWTVPIIVFIWAMVHGSFVLGIGVVVLDSWRRRRWNDGLRWGIGSVVVASLTAHGLGVWQMLLSFLSSRAALAYITEWAPPDLVSAESAPFLIGILLLLHGTAKGRVLERDLWIIGPFLVIGLAASRSVLPAWLALVPTLAVSLTGTPLTALRLPPRGVNAALAPLLLVAPFLLPASSGLDPVRFPLEAAKCLDPDLPLAHDDVVGGYLIYARQDVAVFVDDRAELYGESVFADLIAIRGGVPGWRQTLHDYGITQALFRATDPVTDDLADAGWSTVYRGEEWVVMVAGTGRPRSC